MGKSRQTDNAGAVADAVGRLLVGRRAIAARVAELAAEIAGQYADREVTLLAVLTGSVVFLADLIRGLPLRLRLEVVSVRSYPGEATESRGPDFISQVPSDLAGKDVLIIDDILDSGQTLGALFRAVGEQNPSSLRTCVLLRKDRPDLSDRPRPDFVGFEVADEFVIGYGLDFGDLYRNLPDICVLKQGATR